MKSILDGVILHEHGGWTILPGYWLIVMAGGYCIAGSLN